MEGKNDMLKVEKNNRDFYMKELRGLFNDYITSVSTKRMAASLETVSYLLALCDVFKPKAILDLGSGFSSVGFRWYCKQKGYPLGLVSVDTNEDWLKKTIKYCKKLDLPLFDFETWDYIKKFEIEFDLIFIDLGYSKERPSFYETIFSNFVNKKTIVVFDDAHKSACQISKFMKNFKKKEVDIKDLTQDNKRYCRLFYKVRK